MTSSLTLLAALALSQAAATPAPAPAETAPTSAEERAALAAEKAALAAEKAAAAAERIANSVAPPPPPAEEEKKEDAAAPVDRWTGMAGLGLTYITGNAQNLTLTANIGIDRKWDPWLLGVRLWGAYGIANPSANIMGT